MTRFVDTNILLYAVSSASEDASKRMLAKIKVADRLAGRPRQGELGISAPEAGL